MRFKSATQTAILKIKPLDTTHSGLEPELRYFKYCSLGSSGLRVCTQSAQCTYCMLTTLATVKPLGKWHQKCLGFIMSYLTFASIFGLCVQNLFTVAEFSCGPHIQLCNPAWVATYVLRSQAVCQVCFEWIEAVVAFLVLPPLGPK